MNRKLRIISFVMVVNFLLLSFSGFSSTDETLAAPVKIRDTKILCTATIDQDFDDSSVLVIMDNITGGINKQYELSYFGDIGATSVTDLTILSNDILVASGLVSNDDASRKASDNTAVSTNKVPWFEINEETFRQILKIELNTHSKQNVLEVIRKLERIEGIKYAGPNYKVYPCSDNFASICSLSGESNEYPWGIEITNTVGAWNITVGTDKIKVGVIDSGIEAHPNLVDNLVAGSNFLNNSSTGDTYGHGTEVAGIIGAATGNGLEVQGVCQNVSIVPLKVYTTVFINENGKKDTDGTLDDVIQAITYATNQGIHIINYSVEVNTDVPALSQEIANYPGLFVTSAGNDGKNNDDTAHYPSGYTTTLNNVISVGGADFLKSGDTENRYYTSNYGSNTVDLFAPGTEVMTTSIDNDGQDSVTGTSYAAPFVAGAAALIMSVRPDMTPAEVKKCIMDSTDKMSCINCNRCMLHNCVSGGRLNVYKAVQLATQPQTFTGDVNGDSRADMIITRRTSDGKRAIDTYLGQSDGTFGSVITTSYSQVYNYQDPVFVGDVNGDKLTDLIVHNVLTGKRNLLVYAGKSDGTFKSASLASTTDSHDYYTTKSKFFVADANGDGKDDFIVHTKNSSGKRINLTYLGNSAGTVTTFNSSASTFTSSNNYGIAPVYIGDFNGDLKADIVVPYTSSGKRCLLVYKGKSSAPYFSSGVKFNSNKNSDGVQWPCKEFVSDVNGDRKDDLVVHWRSTDGKRNNLVYKGGSSGLTTEAVVTSVTMHDYIASDEMFIGDVSGEGCEDILVQRKDTSGNRSLLVYRGLSDATYASGNNTVTNDTLDLPVTPSCFFLSDVNGDVRADFIVKYNSGGNVAFMVYKGTTSGTFSSEIYTSASVIPYFNN